MPEDRRSIRGDLIASDDPEWTSVLGQVQHDFYHLPSYVELSASHELGVARAIYVRDGDRTMLLPVIVRELPGGRRDATSPYGYAGPIGNGIDDAPFLTAAFEEARRVMEVDGIVALFVRLHPLLNHTVPDGVGLVVVGHGDTVAIDLTQPADVIWRQMRANHRRQISRAIRSGLTVGIEDADDAFRSFKALYRGTMERREADSYYFFDDAYFDILRAALGDRMQLVVVRVDGSVAAAGLFMEEDKIVEYHLSGTDEKYASHQPTKLMMHFVTSWAQGRGDRWFHLGGGLGAAEDSLLHFKAGFSPLRQRFRTLRMVVDASEYARLTLQRHPSSDPTRLGGYFPAYREPS